MTEGNMQNDQTGGSDVFNVPVIIAAAHELKAPLALIRQLSLAIGQGNVSKKELERIAEKITLTSERSLRLTTDLTRSARLEDSLFTLEPINPISLCEDVVHELTPMFAARGKTIAVKERRRSLLAVGNHDLLRRILLNFADNALHYSAPEAPVVLSVSRIKNGQTIRLSVRDYGPALPATIWKSFDTSLGKRAQMIHSRPESSGLGMYIASQFAGVMGASLGATRHRDGATFYVDLSASTQLRLL